MEPRFHVRDIVHIVDKPVDLESGWMEDMDEFCGKEVRITEAIVHHSEKTGAYRVRLTSTYETIDWWWNDEAFKEFYGETKPAIAEDDLLTLLNG